MRSTIRLPLAASLTFSTLFIARTSAVIDGERYFPLFDDAMVSMRFARNLASGAGLVWNPGDVPVEGYTNLLWTLWMAVLHLLPVSESKVSLLVMMTGAILLAAHLAVVRRLAERIVPESPRASMLAVWLTASFYPLTYWTLRGMEVGLITVLASTGALLAMRLRDTFSRRDLWSLAFVLGAGILTRSDFAIPAAVVAIYNLWHAKRQHRVLSAAVLGGGIAFFAAAHTLFRLWYYGSPLPNTYYLKVEGLTAAVRLAHGAMGLTAFGILTLSATVACAALYLIRRRSADSVLLTGLVAAVSAYSAYVGGDAWDGMLYANRYVTPVIPCLLVLTAAGVDAMLRRPYSRADFALAAAFALAAIVAFIAPDSRHAAPSKMGLPARSLIAALVFAPVFVIPSRFNRAAFAACAVALAVSMNGAAMSHWVSHNAFYVGDDQWATRYGLGLREATREDASIAVTWAGAIAYHADRPSIDLLGKNDPVVARSARRGAPSPGHDKWNYAHSIATLRPDVVAQLWQATDADREAIERWGYVAVSPWAYRRADSNRVSEHAFADISCELARHNPFLAGSPGRAAPDVRLVASQTCN